jgi:indolepyruvate ferredoxin oxidoreductase beta subunit
MNAPVARAGTATRVRPITIAILAMGGEGGGVLADWIGDMAEHGGYLAQATSIPGVAQRTGATIYYLELFPKAAAEARGLEPVLALMPVPGDVDLVVASELMEAGRAVQRGFVTPDRTTLVASTHRVYAMSERIALADGRVDAEVLLDGCRTAARKLVAFDMASLAEATGSVISAVLIGAVAGSGALPFQRAAFEAAIRRGGVGVQASLSAFRAGYEAATSDAPPAPVISDKPAREPSRELASLVREMDETFPDVSRDVVRAGLARTADYQDPAYARLYLDRLRPFLAIEQAHGDGTARLLTETGRQLALGMSYEDTIRVAELKIRPERFARVREEVRATDDQILEIAEFMHPRVQEIAETLPARLGRWLLGTNWARGLVGRFTRKGKIVRTSTLSGFLLLYVLASMKPWRLHSLRYANEQADLERWRQLIIETARRNYRLAIEIAESRSLVKGYGDTHERGRERFEQLIALVPQIVERDDAGETLAELRKVALQDETSASLRAAIEQRGLVGDTARE